MNKLIYLLIVSASLATTLPACAEIVVVVNPNASQTSMSKDEVAQYFLGKSTVLTPIDQTENAPIRAEFYKKVTDRDMSQIKSLWSKLLFTGKATMPKEVADSTEVKKAVASNPKTIGYIEKSAVDSTVKVIYALP